jgi:protein-tyrosine phosphatase
MIDLHCHILPGVDDGAASEAESLEMARIARAEDITTIIATPHFFRDDLPARPLRDIECKLAELELALRKHHIPVRILAGAEISVRHNLIEEIRKRRHSLSINGGSYLFLEFSGSHIFAGVKNLFFELMCEGITPIIAHPERNAVFGRNAELLYGLISMGALAQANSGSFTGLYGSKTAETVRRLLEWNLVHFIASDGHDSASIPPRMLEAVGIAEKLIGAERARALVYDNPKAVLENREVPCLYPPVSPRSKKKSISIKIPGLLRS